MPTARPGTMRARALLPNLAPSSATVTATRSPTCSASCLPTSSTPSLANFSETSLPLPEMRLEALDQRAPALLATAVLALLTALYVVSAPRRAQLTDLVSFATSVFSLVVLPDLMSSAMTPTPFTDLYALVAKLATLMPLEMPLTVD